MTNVFITATAIVNALSFAITMIVVARHYVKIPYYFISQVKPIK